MKVYKVYKWTNKVTGGVYFGSTSNSMQIRAGQNMNGYKSCTRFYAAIKEYGADAFYLSIIAEGLTLEQAVAAERALIGDALSRSDIECYNSDMRSFNPDEDERVQKIISTLREQRSSAEYRKCMSDRMASVWADPERRQHMLAERRKKGRMGGRQQIPVKVLQTGKTYKNCKECAKDLGITPQVLCTVLKRRNHTYRARDGRVFTFEQVHCGCKRK